MPNAGGETHQGVDCNYSTGAIVSNSYGHGLGWKEYKPNFGISIYLHRSSSQYQNISEVRVKSVISNGFIKLY